MRHRGEEWLRVLPQLDAVRDGLAGEATRSAPSPGNGASSVELRGERSRVKVGQAVFTLLLLHLR